MKQEFRDSNNILGKWRFTLDICIFLCYLSLQKDKVNVTLNYPSSMFDEQIFEEVDRL
jgi:hypothetical protein